MNEAKETPAPNVHNLSDEELLAGGVSMTVQPRAGAPFEVKVTECPVLEYQAYFEAVGYKNLGKELLLTTDQPADVLNTLSQKSIIALQEKSREVNVHFLSLALEDLKPASATKLDDLLGNISDIENRLLNELENQGSDTSSPNSDKPTSQPTSFNESAPNA